MDTILTSDFPISKYVFDEMLIEEMKPYIVDYMDGFKTLYAEMLELFKNRFIMFTSGLYYDTDAVVICPDFKTYELKEISDYGRFDDEAFLRGNTLLSTFDSELPTLTWLKSIAPSIKEFFGMDVWIVCVCDDKRYSSYLDLICLHNIHTNKLTVDVTILEENDLVIAFPIVELDMEEVDVIDFMNNICCKYGLCPYDLPEESKIQLADYSIMKDYIKFEGERMSYNSEEIARDLIAGKQDKIYNKPHGNLIEILKSYNEERKIRGIRMQSKKELLNCEKVRADIEPYEERILTDPNRGHWDLWLEDDSDVYTVKMENEFMARNPKCDINKEGVIAIDFGTKSTIVVYQSDIEHSLPMGIGDGNLSKAPTPKRYENPTVMQFVNLEKFLEAYKGKEGRPDTIWEDLPISHTALDKFRNSKSEEYYAFLHQIKQWAGRREKQFRIQPINGESLLLPAFMDLGEDDVNPIEIYAYYIGLYINNMRKGHGIFLDYYLSFPVTYETKIRQKIVESFTKGLKKSLPISVQQDDEIMSCFKVNGDISEPAAYAVCALQEYGFEPSEDEEIFYGIFDFGGGTTDFDFGLWKNSQKRRYDYRIENFGAAGDEFLGGENLLEMLAFEIFKANQDIMRENNYTFTLAPKAKEFIGSDALLSDSQEAEKNMHNLMEVLRPYWEKTEVTSINGEDEDIDYIVNKIIKAMKTSAYYTEISEVLSEIEENFSDDIEGFKEALASIIDEYEIVLDEESDENVISLKVSLFDKEGKDHPNVELTSSLEFIDDFIEGKIREGVKNFFAALLLSYQNEKVRKSPMVNILLAGNSCKSPVVKKVFEEEIVEQEKNIKEKFGLDKADKMFEIFPPLGTKEAYKKMEERGITFSEDDFEKPTGKTGVAFGLIQCRAGGTIERVSNIDRTSEIPFQYFLGWQSKKKFVLFKDDIKLTTLKGKPDYKQWYKFIEADADTFYLYYTTLPECADGDLMVDGNAAVKRIKCNIDNVDDEAFIYIRATSPHSIQYAVATDYDVENNIIGEIYTKELN